MTSKFVLTLVCTFACSLAAAAEKKESKRAPASTEAELGNGAKVELTKVRGGLGYLEIVSIEDDNVICYGMIASSSSAGSSMSCTKNNNRPMHVYAHASDPRLIL